MLFTLIALLLGAVTLYALTRLSPAHGIAALFWTIPVALFSVDLSLMIIGLVKPYQFNVNSAPLDSPQTKPPERVTPPPIIVPAMVRSDGDIVQVSRCLIENWSLENHDPVEIVLLIDLADAASPSLDTDLALRADLEQTVADLNTGRVRQGKPPAAMLFRQRVWNSFDRSWMGWERKRGKVVEFLRFTRGAATSFEGLCDSRWRQIPRVFVMDLDTRIASYDLVCLSADFEGQRASASPHSRPSVISPVVRTLDCINEPLQRWLYEPWILSAGKDWRQHTLRSWAFGRDICNGKGLLAVDDFLDSSSAIEDNTILSHDHLEAIIGNGCFSPNASVHEPFPETRDGWERRQHRWMRGDFQVLPWLVKRSRNLSGAPMTLGMRAGVAHILANSLNPVALYCAILACLALGPLPGVVIALALIAMHRDGILLALCRVPLFVWRSEHSHGLSRTMVFFGGNSVLKSFGTLLYLQRDALITATALAISIWRLAAPGRKGLIEWYPANADWPIRHRQQLEFVLVTASAALYAGQIASLALPAVVIAWTLIPIILNGVIVRRLHVRSPQF